MNEAINFWCTSCKAPAGDAPCETPNGRATKTHVARVRAALKADALGLDFGIVADVQRADRLAKAIA